MYFLKYLYEKIVAIKKRLRAFLHFTMTGIYFKSIGFHPKIRGEKGISVGANTTIGDFCWIEAVTHYGNQSFKPLLVLGANVALSDFVHISCVKSISIGDGTLLGSKIYIGDHSHGSYKQKMTIEELNIPPSLRILGDIDSIKIGKNCWIGDNVVILPGTEIGDGCIIGATSVVKGNFPDYCIIAGVPAKIVKEFVNDKN